MRSDNLRRHLESCQKNSSFQKNIDHSAIEGSIFQKEAPKVAALADAIINNHSTNGLQRGKRMETDDNNEKTLSYITSYQDGDYIDSVNEGENSRDDEEIDSNEDRRTAKYLPSTLEGLTDGDYIDSVNEDENSSDDEKMDSDEDRRTVKFLPSTLEGLSKRFNELLQEYNLDGKYEHRNELVFLLDEMLRQEGINREEYEKLNNEIGSIASREGNQMEDENVEKSTVKAIIQYDVKELKDLLKEFKEDLKEEYTDTLLKIEELVDLFDDDSFIDDESVLEKIFHQLNKLDESNLKKSKLLRFRMLSKDIERNRFRVKEILTRFKDGSDDSHTLSMLKREKLLSKEQADKINKVLKDGKDLKQIANIIKSTKIGNDLDHLPTKINDLKNVLQIWLTELANTGKNDLRQKVGAVLDEMLRRRVITQNRYNLIKEDNNIF